MAPIPIKRVVSTSSQDGLNPSSNLLGDGNGRKWLTSREEKGRRAEVVLELSKKARIHSVEIGNFGSAFLEILVSSPSPPGINPPTVIPDSDWLTLLPSCMLMTVQDSRAGRNKTTTLSCTRDRFSATAANQKWSYIKIVCRQPYNAVAQFGLQYVSFYSEYSGPRSPVTAHFTPSPSHPHQPTPHHSTHISGGTPHRTTKHKLPSLPSVTPCKQGDPNSKPPHLKSSKGPKRPLREANTKEGGEFSGVEKQSRLLKNALKGPKGSSPSNPILERITSEREKLKQEKNFESLYEKKQLLLKALPKALGKTDFTAGYGKSPKTSSEISAAFRKISCHDNGYEIGQEPEDQPWGTTRGRRRKRSRAGEGEMSEEGWVTKRKKKLSGMISECRKVLSRAGDAGGTNGRAEDLSSTSIDDETTPIKSSQYTSTLASADCGSDSDSDATVIMDYPEEQPLSTSPLSPSSLLLPLPSAQPPKDTHIQCPLCCQPFPSYAIELHAASCGDAAAVHGSTYSSLPLYID